MEIGAAALAARRVQDSSKSVWIRSPFFDLAFLILSPLAGLALLLAYPVGGSLASIAVATLIGGPHYLASLSFYFWDDSKPYYRSRWMTFFAGPVALVGFVVLVLTLKIPAILLVLIYLWNAYHVSRQSCGILSLYRHRLGVSDPKQKTLANTAILTTNMSMALAHTEWYPTLHSFLSRPSATLPAILWHAAAAAASLSLIALAISLVRRERAGKGPSVGELAFLASSLLLFHPYLWIRDADQATLGMLTGHFIQYLAIVWLVNSRKLAHRTGSAGQRYLAQIWTNPRVMFPVLFVCGCLFMLLQTQVMAVTLTLVLLHFYLDGIFWAFKRPEIRKAMIPHLT